MHQSKPVESAQSTLSTEDTEYSHALEVGADNASKYPSHPSASTTNRESSAELVKIQQHYHPHSGITHVDYTADQLTNVRAPWMKLAHEDPQHDSLRYKWCRIYGSVNAADNDSFHTLEYSHDADQSTNLSRDRLGADLET